MRNPNDAVRAARAALLAAEQARVQYDREVARVARERDPRYIFAMQQNAAAAADAPSQPIEFKHNREALGREIKWDVIVRREPSKSVYGFKDRRSAERHAVSLRSRDLDPRIMQQGL